MIPLLESASLADALPLLLAQLPRAVAAEANRQPLWTAARALLPLVRGGFELRLTEGDQQVDIHQLIMKPEEREALIEYIERRAFEHPAWSHLYAFTKAWTDKRDLLHDGVNSVWLELDGDLLATGAVVPSVFAGFVYGSQRRAAQRETLRLLLPMLDPAVTARIEALADAASVHGGWVSHVGAMLARAGSAVRVNVHHLPLDAAADFLQSVNWSGDFNALASMLSWLDELGDTRVLTLDVGERVYPQIGIEVSFRAEDNTIPRWKTLLDSLTERGLCATEKAAALPAWQQFVTPATAPVDWVDWLIVENLLERPNELCAISCLLHHVKVTLTPNGIAAKGYLLFQTKWMG